MPYERNDAFAEHFAETGKDRPPRHLNVRFDAAGTFLPQAGNTVVCHVVDGSATQQAIVRTREALMALPNGNHFAHTPVSSLHMTVFQGTIDTVFQGTIDERRKPDYWPKGIALDVPEEETTKLFLDRLREFPPAPPFRMRVTEVTPLGLVLTGATQEDEHGVRALRDALTVPFGYRHPDHDGYTFHITLAYLKNWLPDDAEAAYRPALEELAHAFAAEIDVVELGDPAFCAFPDMTEFRPLRCLG